MRSAARLLIVLHKPEIKKFACIILVFPCHGCGAGAVQHINGRGGMRRRIMCTPQDITLMEETGQCG